MVAVPVVTSAFLLTPLREGRQNRHAYYPRCFKISTHAPAGGATREKQVVLYRYAHFYSRPCGRGDDFK